ncbi:hypothetical protein HL658_31230 [Azospirillum sp. RWY-5-1]|uniref:Transcriptional regulator n=1 Tax=Azospirillum oleiclasticum TaxID=2735135 RepID=A0ABX2TME3_9PROT|nr:hypothetical protein [Azospirillum oleiclasticum]NYZ17038.1 hypothetical protein [Azospirillum oleiclasticum]NYZ24518.1 hypothetical protein [Azospirillum oleiclasticum]
MMMERIAIIGMLARASRGRPDIHPETVLALRHAAEVEKRHGTGLALSALLDVWVSTLATMFASTGDAKVLEDGLAVLEIQRKTLLRLLSGDAPAGTIRATATPTADDVLVDVASATPEGRA